MNMPESRLSRGHYGIAIVVANKQKMKIKGGGGKRGLCGGLLGRDWLTGESLDSEDE